MLASGTLSVVIRFLLVSESLWQNRAKRGVFYGKTVQKSGVVFRTEAPYSAPSSVTFASNYVFSV